MLWMWLACQSTDAPSTENVRTGPIEVWSLSYPVHYLAERIGGKEIELHALLPEGEDAAHWWPTPAQITQVAEADLLLANGADFEGWLKTASLPTGLVVPAAKGFSAIVLEGQTHSHGKGGEHSHAGIDPHVWMDPDIYQLQAQQVAKALKARDPEHAELYQARFEELSSELNSLIAESTPILAGLQGYALAANHPAFNYWMRRFDLSIHNFDVPADEAPSASGVIEAQSWAESSTKALLIWEDAPSEALQMALQGYLHLHLDNLEGPEAGQAYNYMTQYRGNLEDLQRFLSAQAKEEPHAP